MTSRTRAWVCAGMVLVLSGCGSSPATPPAAPGATPTPTTGVAAAPVSPAPQAAGSIAASSPSPTARPAWEAYTTPGFVGIPAVGPDGTFYATVNSAKALWVIALDATGHMKAGWPYHTADADAYALTLGPDGTVFLATGGQTNATPGHVVALDPAGQPKAGWPVATKSVPFAFKFGPDGTVYFAGTSGADNRIYALEPDASAKPGWPVAVPGTMETGFQLTPDGAVFVGQFTQGQSSFTSHIYGYGPDGRRLLGWPLAANDLESPTLAADGTVYATSILTSTRTVYAFDRTGKPVSGWHAAKLPGWPFAPTVAADGTLYVIVGLGPNMPNEIVALDSTGALKPTWKPYTFARALGQLPAVIAPSGDVVIPQSKMGANNMYVNGPDVVLGPNGRPLTAWPKSLVDSLGGPVFGPGGTAYVVSGAAVYAFAPDGSGVAGWPYRVPTGSTARTIAVGSDGTVYVVEMGKGTSLIVALEPDGRPVGS